MRYSILLLLALTGWQLSAQELAGSKNLDQAILASFSYGPHTASGDLADRFGGGWGVGIDLDYSPRESPWLYGLMGRYLFGNDVKQDVLAGLRLTDGSIVGDQRGPADLQLRMRGYFAGLRVGRILSFGGENLRGGLKLSVGVGWLSHRIRIQNDASQNVNQVQGDYRAGYDRLTAGPAAYQFLGYQQLSRNGRVNFFAGAELFEGFTSSQRDFDIASGAPLDGSRLDVITGFRVGLILPFYTGEGREIFYR